MSAAAPSTLTNPTLTSSVHDRAETSTTSQHNLANPTAAAAEADKNNGGGGGYINPFIQATPPTSPPVSPSPLQAAVAGGTAGVAGTTSASGVVADSDPAIASLERTNSLEKYLQSRPDAKDLRERGILIGGEGVSP